MLLRRLNTSDAECCNDGHSLLKLGFKSHFMECLVLKLSLQGAIARHVLVGLAGILGSAKLVQEYLHSQTQAWRPESTISAL